MAKGLGWSEDVVWSQDLSVHLPEEVQPGVVFPLRALDTNFVRRHPGPQMYRCVDRTKVAATLLLTYPHVLE